MKQKPPQDDINNVLDTREYQSFEHANTDSDNNSTITCTMSKFITITVIFKIISICKKFNGELETYKTFQSLQLLHLLICTVIK